MSLFGNAASAAQLALVSADILQLVTNFLPSTPSSGISVSVRVPDTQPNGQQLYHQGGFTFSVPNHSTEFGKMAIAQTKQVLAQIELAVACQKIFDPEGGLTIKDQLDPYHYENVKNALEEQGEPVPPLTNPPDSIINKLGDGIIEQGILSQLGNILTALQTIEQLGLDIPLLSPLIAGGISLPIGLSPAPGPTDNRTEFNVEGFWPDISQAIAIMTACNSIQAFLMQYMVGLIRNSIDTESNALLVKTVLGEWGKEVTDQTLEATGKTPPDWQEPTGEEGLHS